MDGVAVEALLEETVKFITTFSQANDANSSPSGTLHAVKPIFRRFKLWKHSYHTPECPLDMVLSDAPVQAEAVLVLLCNFVTVVLEEFGHLGDPEALERLRDVLLGLGLASDSDDLSEPSSAGSEPESIQQTAEQDADVRGIYRGVVELLRVVDSLFELAPVLDELIDQILERKKIMEMRGRLPVDLRAFVVTIASKFPQAPEQLVLTVAKKILINRNRLQGKPTEVARERPARIYPGERKSNVPTLFSRASLHSGLSLDSGLSSSFGSLRNMSISQGSSPDTQWTTPTTINSNPLLFISEDRSVTASSYVSAMDSDNSSSERLPQMPAQESDGHVRCEICHQKPLIVDSKSWRKHVLGDIEPYFCLEPNCTERQTSFKAKRFWKAHDTRVHKPATSRCCPFRCRQDESLDKPTPLGGREWYRHVGKHLDELAVFALQPSLWQTIPEDMFSSSEGLSLGVGAPGTTPLTLGAGTRSNSGTDFFLRLQEYENVENLVEHWVSEVSLKSQQEQDDVMGEAPGFMSDTSDGPARDRESPTVLNLGPRVNQETARLKPVCFRILNLPLEWEKEQLLQALRRADESLLANDECRLSIYPACGYHGQVALLSLPASCSSYLQDIASHEDRVVRMARDEPDLVIDKHFNGLTPLNRPGEEIFADVVAVTGLAGHAFGSWSNRTSNRMWLQDFLPRDVKGLRIMTFGYNSELVGPNASEARLLDHRRDLIQQLESARRSEEERRRPIIFLGHSLGGVLILQALMLSKTQALYSHVLDSTRAMFFFGVPYQGLHSRELEAMVQDMSSSEESQAADLLKQLREGSEFLQKQRDELVDIWSGRDIFSYYEPVKTPTVAKSPTSDRYQRNGGLAKMVKDVSAQLFLQNERRIPVHRNHTEMVKFLSSSDTAYQSVVAHLQQCVDSIQKEIEEARRIGNESDRKKAQEYLRSLNVPSSDCLDKRDELLAKRHENTCSYLFDDPRYQDWAQDGGGKKQGSFLWIRGSPGTGKSVLAAYLSQKVELADMAKNKNRTCGDISIVAYFFCKGTDERLRTENSILKHLLGQILRRNHRLYHYFQQELDDVQKQWTTGMLWRVFEHVCKDDKLRLSLIIDALDECEKAERAAFLDRLQTLVDTASINLKLVITSRPHVPVSERFTSISLDNFNSKDIERYITSEVQELAKIRRFPVSLEEEIRNSLMSGARGMFLWVALIMEDLKSAKQTNRRAIREKLKTLPKDITALYTRTLERIEFEDENKARKVLQCVVYAKRPLTLDELRHAIAVTPQHTSLEDMEDDLEHDLKWFLQQTFESLLLIGHDGVVDLIHQSAKDYLLSFDSEPNAATASHVGPRVSLGLSAKDANSMLAVACLSYICLDVFDIGQLSRSMFYGSPEYSHLTLKYAFIHYAAMYYPEHAQAMPSLHNIEIPSLLLDVFHKVARSERNMNFAYQIWYFKKFAFYPSYDKPNLVIAAHFGIYSLLKVLINLGIDINAHSDVYGEALYNAVAWEHERVAQLLLESGADVNYQNKRGRTALHRAADKGHKRIVQLLLESGADVNSKDKFGRTALYRATCQEHERIVQLLLESGADVNSKDMSGITALHRAANRGHERIVQLLLESGADVNSKDNEGRTALLQAAGEGHERTVQLLLESGADVTISSYYQSFDDNQGTHWTALEVAVHEGHERIAQLLRKYGAR